MNSSKLKFKRFFFKSKLYKLNSLFNRFYIIPYHMVVDKPNGFYPEISTQTFRRQIEYLVRNYRIMSLDEIAERLNSGKSLNRCMAITFDDGFRNNYENAYPILKKYKIPATIFLITGNIETRKAPWFINVRYMFMKTEKPSLDLRIIEKEATCLLRTRDERYEASSTIMSHLMDLNDGDRNLRIKALYEELGVKENQQMNSIMLDWKQIKTMHENGISFGAHTVNHPVLSRVPKVTAEIEIFESKKIIEDKIDTQVISFAYPFGKKHHYNSITYDILRRLEFKCAVTSEFGSNAWSCNLFELKRCPPFEVDLLD